MPKTSHLSSDEPLTPVVLHILMSLVEGELHGYAIMQAVAAQSSNTLKMGPGTLYGSIKRMLAMGYIIESIPSLLPVREDERRRYYQLTDLGRKAFELEVQRLDRILKTPAARLVLKGSNP